MSPHRSTGTSQRKLMLFFIAVLWVLASGSLAQAGPSFGATVIASAARAVPYHGSNRPIPLRLTLPALPVARLQPAPLPHVDSRPVQALPGANKSLAAQKDANERPDPGLAIRWRESRELVGPDVVSLVRNYRRDGLPVVQLWQAKKDLLAIGLNPHGVPGIYFTHHVGG